MPLIACYYCKPVELEKITAMRKMIAEDLKNLSLPNGVEQNILVCFSEAASNLARHADPAPTVLQIQLFKQQNTFQLSLEDDGAVWDPTLPQCVKKLDPFMDEAEGGRGVALMHALCDQIIYKPKGAIALNQLSFDWALNPPKQKLSLLLVDDDESQLRLLHAYLNQDYHLFKATDGQQALVLLEQYKVDAIISDITMPNMDGLGLKQKLLQQKTTSTIPFIYLTSAVNEVIQHQAIELGIDDYITKPIKKIDLLRIIKRVTQRSAQLEQRFSNKFNQDISAALPQHLPTRAYGWQLALANRNTGGGGGDVVLYKNLHSSLLIVMLDIMGHDISAKFFSYAYSGYLYGMMQHVENHPSPCSALLNALSQAAYDDNLLSKICLTCCVVEIKNNGECEIATAGHPAPLQITANKLTAIDTFGSMLGLYQNQQYQSQSVRLNKNQRIALYTDGLIESAILNHQRDELKNNIMKRLLSTADQPLDLAIKNIMITFDNFGDPSRDDVTLILLEWQGDY